MQRSKCRKECVRKRDSRTLNKGFAIFTLKTEFLLRGDRCQKFYDSLNISTFPKNYYKYFSFFKEKREGTYQFHHFPFTLIPVISCTKCPQVSFICPLSFCVIDWSMIAIEIYSFRLIDWRFEKIFRVRKWGKNGEGSNNFQSGKKNLCLKLVSAKI